MPSLLQQKGTAGELMAKKFLEGQGYRFIEQHWCCRYGELDLILWDKSELVFCEVKLRSSNDYGYPEEMVTHHKKRCLVKTALSYISRKKLFGIFWRFDIIAITKNIHHYEIRHFMDTIRQEYSNF